MLPPRLLPLTGSSREVDAGMLTGKALICTRRSSGSACLRYIDPAPRLAQFRWAHTPAQSVTPGKSPAPVGLFLEGSTDANLGIGPSAPRLLRMMVNPLAWVCARPTVICAVQCNAHVSFPCPPPPPAVSTSLPRRPSDAVPGTPPSYADGTPHRCGVLNLPHR